jgi:hypothetical protein
MQVVAGPGRVLEKVDKRGCHKAHDNRYRLPMSISSLGRKGVGILMEVIKGEMKCKKLGTK